MFDLSGKKAIVTGGTRGLGYGMAEGLMEAGAEVVIFGSNEKVYDVAATFCERGLSCQGAAVDLAQSKERQRAFAQALNMLNGIDILINSAGIQRRYPCEDFPLEEWRLVLEVNLTATFELCQLAGRELIKKGYGKIINIASMQTFFGGLTIPAYAASKGGIGQLTKALGNEWVSKGVNVNAIAPGYMDTELNTALMDPAHPRYQLIVDRIPAHRWGVPDDMKGAAIFLASRASDYMSGTIISVDGGYSVM